MGGHGIRLRGAVIAAGGWFALITAACVATPALALTPQQIFAKDAPSIVVVVAYDASGKAIELGSGVVIAKGQVVTNCHVVKNGTTLQVKQGKIAHSADFRYADYDRDLCQLSVPGLTAPTVMIGNAKTLQPGASVVAIGAPEGLDLTISAGLVSSLREIGGGSKIIQTSAAISPGSSGGGLFDDQGRLVGITFAYLTKGQNLNFALPVNWIAQLAARSAAARTTTVSSISWLTEAAALEQQKDWVGLKAHAKRWTEMKPQIAMAWATLGSANFHMGNFTEARSAAGRALKLAPASHTAWQELGAIDLALEQYSAAVDECTQALRLDSRSGRAWYCVGVANFAMYRYSDAASALSQSGQLNFTGAWRWAGNAYLELNDFDSARVAFARAVTADTSDADAWYSLGVVCAQQSDRDCTLAAYQHLRKLDAARAERLFTVIPPR